MAAEVLPWPVSDSHWKKTHPFLWETRNSLPAPNISESPTRLQLDEFMEELVSLRPGDLPLPSCVLRLGVAGLVRVGQQVCCPCRETVSSPGEILITFPTPNLPTAGLVAF